MGVGLHTVLSSLCCFHSSVRSSEVVDSAGSGQQLVPDRGAHKQDETKLDPTPLHVDHGTPPPPNVSSKERPEKQTTTSATAVPEKIKHDNLQASGQAPTDANGFFNNAHDLIFYHPVMNNINETKEEVLRWLAVFTMSGAEFDASGHVPGCHPGTRITILETLQHWIDDTQHICRMLWLHGPAGVGKSAVLQSLAERLSETSKLGATLFFSRPNGRHNPIFVIPTIAYQLAVRIPAYKDYVNRLMISNPKLLEKDMERQFWALIVEPFTKLKLIAASGRWAILLDGLDECQGENAQTLIIKLINRFTRRYPTNPLIWVIASRPEAHLQVAFNSEEVNGSFKEHEILANSDDACRDVEKFLRAKFGEIRRNYRDLIPLDVPWPAEQDIARVSKTSSGLFALATTIVNYVDDPDACDPISQLATVLSVTEGLEPGSLSALYTLYSAILAGVPKTMSPILKLVLAIYTTLGRGSSVLTDGEADVDDFPLVFFATVFGLQQHTVYGALRKLHSVIKVPPLNESGSRGIKFYHASFSDYLKTLGTYALDVSVVTKLWWGYFAIMHGMDSTAYRNAISDGRPPVPLSWDVTLADSVVRDMWDSGLECLLHLVLPECPVPGDAHFDHAHLSLNAKEIQNVFEKIDFSALIFQHTHVTIFPELFDLFEWLAGASPELAQLDVVKKIPLKDLDLTFIPGAKLSHEFSWTHGGRLTGRYGRDSEDESTRLSYNVDSYITRPAQQLHEDQMDKTLPIEGLVSKLDKLRSDNPTVDILIVGGRPSRRCAFICNQPTTDGWGSFYYVPYS